MPDRATEVAEKICSEERMYECGLCSGTGVWQGRPNERLAHPVQCPCCEGCGYVVSANTKTISALIRPVLDAEWGAACEACERACLFHDGNKVASGECADSCRALKRGGGE